MNDLTSLMRGTVGYHDILRNPHMTVSNFPPHNIEELSENKYRITLAVAGYLPEDITVSVDNGFLNIQGKREDESSTEAKFLYRGIALRNFAKSIKLSEHIEVTDALMEHGLLTIDLERIIPEDKKPRIISIR